MASRHHSHYKWIIITAKYDCSGWLRIGRFFRSAGRSWPSICQCVNTRNWKVLKWRRSQKNCWILIELHAVSAFQMGWWTAVMAWLGGKWTRISAVNEMVILWAFSTDTGMPPWRPFSNPTFQIQNFHFVASNIRIFIERHQPIVFDWNCLSSVECNRTERSDNNKEQTRKNARQHVSLPTLQYSNPFFFLSSRHFVFAHSIPFKFKFNYASMAMS